MEWEMKNRLVDPLGWKATFMASRQSNVQGERPWLCFSETVESADSLLLSWTAGLLHTGRSWRQLPRLTTFISNSKTSQMSSGPINIRSELKHLPSLGCNRRLWLDPYRIHLDIQLCKSSDVNGNLSLIGTIDLRSMYLALCFLG